MKPVPYLAPVLAALLLAAPSTVLAQTSDAEMTAAATDPAAFAAMAASANMFEIESSQLALDKAASDEVKSFAQKMIDDHTAAGERMKAAAEAAGVTVPDEMSEADRKALNDLQGAGEIDQAYVAAQVQAHDKAVALFEAFSTGGAAGPLQEFAAETLPTLRDHKALVDGMAGK